MDIQSNADKSYLFVVGKSYGEVLPALSINGSPIVWANSLRYLGVKFVSDKRLHFSSNAQVLCCSECYFSHCKYASEFTKLLLLESFTLPMLTYSLNAIFLSRTQMLKLNSCWNNIYIKIFGYFKWESVKEIQRFSQRLDFIHVVDKCKFSFFKQVVYELF